QELQEQIDNWKPDASGDMADRLARRCLTGRGIVMGFEVWHTQQYTLHIGPGLGISSEGHVVRFREGEYFTHYREWKERAEYKIFQGKGGKGVAAWELVPKSADETGCTPLTPQRGSHLHMPFIEGKVVLAFIPPEGTPPGEESKISFVLVDQQDMARLLGAKRLLELLVADHEDTDVTWEEDYSPLDEIPGEEDFRLALRPELGLVEIPLPRFGFNPRDKCSKPDLDCTDFPDIRTFDDLYTAYHPSVQDALMRLDGQLKQIIRWYGKMLFPQFSTDYFEERLEKMMDKWTDYAEYCEDYNEKKSQPAKFPNLPPEEPHWFVQYYYDWARDLIAAYHELRDELNALMAASCLAEQDEPKAQHPRHLMLGLALREEHTGLASPLRHEFVQPPIYNDNAARLERCRLYFRRWFLMVQGFYLPIDKDPVANPTCHRDDDGNFPNPLNYSALKITPGRSYFHPLSAQSLPFYYLVTLGTQSVHRFWNYRRAKTGTADQLLCYHASDAASSYSKLAHVIRPLYYTLDAYDFYRVEGHLGMPASAVADLEHMVRKYNLDFHVTACPLDDLIALLESDTGPCPTPLRAFKDRLLGAEHLAGVPKGGTLILVTDGGNVVADFSVPYRVPED
ncbi:MAG TPA: hypothetical protein PKD78_11030, partial [Saprospiraceae bacterium]|nr:hypothetical protein [Saprospiraceae bacterium]